MINFLINFEDKNNSEILNNFPLSFEGFHTIFDLKANIAGVNDYDFNDFSLILENYGVIDSGEMLELPLDVMGLESGKYYNIFVQFLKKVEKNWKLLCTERIIGDNPITQIGFICESNTNTNTNKPVCYACKTFCRSEESTKEIILENNFYCMCNTFTGKSCKFSQCEKTENLEEIMKNINNILQYHVEQIKIREKLKIQKDNQKYLERNFDFEKSIQGNLPRVIMYENKSVIEKVNSIIPIQELQKKAMENSLKSNLDYKDELVKSLLEWFKKNYFTWCDRPKCLNCVNKVTDAYVETQTPTEDESKWHASRTEIYKCLQCNKNSRFPRYNNPAKLCDTKTGRCGEWANLFGCILRNLGYEVRFIDNFEDHVWNEYWSESLKRWIHVDSCEMAWDTPLIYEQGWGRNMTYILAFSTTGIYDVTRRYVKDWNVIEPRRKATDVTRLNKLLEANNFTIRAKVSSELVEFYYNRDAIEQSELLGKKEIKKTELAGRESGSEEWKKNRGEIK